MNLLASDVSLKTLHSVMNFMESVSTFDEIMSLSLMDGKVLQNFQKSFLQVQDILDQNRLLINEINQNHESKQADHLGRNVGLIRELNNNIRTVASLYGGLSHSFAKSIDASSGESTGTLRSNGKANNQKRSRCE
ncbi:unnamed protein product [Brassica oleracea var. botrytis]